jgi:hypothetical protein
MSQQKNSVHHPAARHPVLDPHEIGVNATAAERVQGEAEALGLRPPTTTAASTPASRPAPPIPPPSPASAIVSEDDLRAMIERGARAAVHHRRWGSEAFWRPIGEDLRRLIAVARRANAREQLQAVAAARPPVSDHPPAGGSDPDQIRALRAELAAADSARRAYDALRGDLEAAVQRRSTPIVIKDAVRKILAADDARRSTNGQGR